jgi:hypothetical protein
MRWGEWSASRPGRTLPPGYARKNKQEYYPDKFIATFYDQHLVTVQNVRHSFQCATLLVPNKSLLPTESFWGDLKHKQHPQSNAEVPLSRTLVQ